MSIISQMAWRDCVSHWLVISVLLVAGVAVSSCGSDSTGQASTGSAATQVGTGSVPLYDASTQLLTLPQLRMGDSILTDVKLSLKSQGTWAVVSKGAVRPGTAADSPAATFDSPGSKFDLASAQIDGTLTVARLHAGARVFSNVAIKLTGNKWAFGSAPQEIKTLHAEDFKSNTAIAADESHHVVLNSGPSSGVQSVPMRLSTRPYKFCMDAQAGGADSMTLLDAGRSTVFTLKAGEACITINAAEGRYTMEHRYGGSGKNRTVFMHHEENTATAANAGKRQQAPLGAAVASARPITAAVALKASTGTDLYSPGPEYWSVKSPLYGSNGWLGDNNYLYNSRPEDDPCRGVLGLGSPGLRTPIRNSLLKVEKDALVGTPVALGANSNCPFPDFTYMMLVGGSMFFDFDSAVGRVQSFRFDSVEFDRIPFVDGRGISTNNTCIDGSCFGGVAALDLVIKNQDANTFQLFAEQSKFVASGQSQQDNRLNAPAYRTPFVVKQGNKFLINAAAGETGTKFIVDARYFPAGLVDPQLNVGEYALFANANCTGAAYVTSSPFTSSNYNAFNDFSGRFQSIQMGLSTRAVFTDGVGALKQFNQLSCTPIGTPGIPARQGVPDGFVIPPDTVIPSPFPPSFNIPPTTIPTEFSIFITPVVDTVAFKIRTDSCELCNLAYGDFTGTDLSGVKLRGANLAHALMANIDLSRADLRFTNLQGAVMSGSNLEAANLCSAQLNAIPIGTVAAFLSGAHMKNTNLTGAVLNGVDFSNASFYSSGQPATCQENSCDSYALPTCAGATGASIENTNFDSAYLANVDMSGATGRGVNFANATLFGVSLSGAKLGVNADAGTGTKFSKARLQGVNFANAEVSYADFTGAQMDLDSSCIQATLGAAFLQFPGSKVPVSSGSSSCVLGKQAAPFCVKAIFAASPAYPATNCTNACADGKRSGAQTKVGCSNTDSCSLASWTSALSTGVPGGMPTSSCFGKAQLCNDFSNPANVCW